jgi:hypothetical protein
MHWLRVTADMVATIILWQSRESRGVTAAYGMATFQRQIGWRAVRHGVVESVIHQEDVALNNERRGRYWLGVDVKPEDGHHNIPELGGGLYFVRNKETGGLEQAEGDDFIQRMDDWVKEKNWYYREVEDPKCKGGKRWKRTKTKGVQGQVVSCSPWWSNLIYEAARNGQADKVKELSLQISAELKVTIEKQTRRQVLSVQVHYDTVNLHAHVFSTRIGEDHKFIRGTTKRIGLIGPWSCGVLRQGEHGFIPQDSTNFQTAHRLYQRNEKRTGEPPLDFMLCKTVDLLCAAMFGASPRLTFWRRVYMQGLPPLSFNRLLALHDAVGREVQAWEKFAARSRDYVPHDIVLGRGVNGGRELHLN